MRKLGKYICFAAAVALIGCLSGCNFGWKTSYIYQNGDKYVAGDREITEKIETIDLDYLSGDVTLTGTDASTVTIRETSETQLDDQRKVHTWVDGTTLYVRYCASAKGLDVNFLKKNLEIQLPADVKLSDVKVKVSSGDLTYKDLEAENVNVHASSGDVEVSGAAKKMDLQVSSGDLTLNQRGDSEEIKLKTSSGEIFVNAENAGVLDVHSSSGKVKVEAKSVKDFRSKISSGAGEYKFASEPETIDVSHSSGSATFYLPKESNLTGEFKASSGKLSYDLAFSKNGDNYVCGNGANLMKVHVSSGNINVKGIDGE